MLHHEICCNRKIKTCCKTKCLIDVKRNSIIRDPSSLKCYVCLLISERIHEFNLLGLRVKKSLLCVRLLSLQFNSSRLHFVQNATIC